jgi:hypothetical protein
MSETIKRVWFRLLTGARQGYGKPKNVRDTASATNRM